MTKVKTSICSKPGCAAERAFGEVKHLKYCAEHANVCTKGNCLNPRGSDRYRCKSHSAIASNKSRKNRSQDPCPVEGCGKPRAKSCVRCVEHRKEWQLWAKYKLTLSEYDALLVNQNGRCAVCLEIPQKMGAAGWHVDHDHTTGVVRGLLCARCNVAVGMLRNSPTIAEAAAAYLRRVA